MTGDNLPATPPVPLDQATALEGADGFYEINLDDRWQLWGPSGGYLSAIALRAAGAISQLPKPSAFYCHFLKSPRFDAVEVKASFERAGRRAESISVSIEQDGDQVLTALIRTTADGSGHTHDLSEMPPAQAPNELEPFRYSGPRSELFTYWNNFERRPAITVSGRTSRDPVSREWVRSIPKARFDDPFIDAARPLLMLDTFGYLAARQKYTDNDLVAPNLDTSVWFHDIGAQTDWLLLEHTNPVSKDGVMFVSGNVWSEDGKLVSSGSAQLLQLAG